MTAIRQIFRNLNILSSNNKNINYIDIKKSCLACRKYSNSNIKTNNNVKCWRCGLDKNNFEIFCNSCNVIQKPPETNNYFKILRVNESFDLDSRELTNNFRKLQSQLHPDKYSNKSEDEKNISQEYSSIVNQAYSHLVSPLQRGMHLLNLKGETITETENTSNDMEFLSEIMEMSEEVEEANTPKKLKKLERKNKDILEDLNRQLSDSFYENDMAEAKKILIKMKYFYSIAKQISNLLREKGIVD